MAGKVITGARAKVYLTQNGVKSLVGIFTNVSYGVTYDAQPAFILGRFSAAEIDYTAAEVIQISASGWRVYGRAPTVAAANGGPGMPKLQDLLHAEYSEFEIFDRGQDASAKPAMKVVGVRHLGADGGFTARQLSEMSLKFMGLRLSDENGDPSVEGPGATDLT